MQGVFRKVRIVTVFCFLVVLERLGRRNSASFEGLVSGDGTLSFRLPNAIPSADSSNTIQVLFREQHNVQTGMSIQRYNHTSNAFITPFEDCGIPNQ